MSVRSMGVRGSGYVGFRVGNVFEGFVVVEVWACWGRGGGWCSGCSGCVSDGGCGGVYLSMTRSVHSAFFFFPH